MSDVLKIAQQSKIASTKLLEVSESKRNEILHVIAANLRKFEAKIISANLIDLQSANENKQKISFIDRLTLSKKVIEQMASSCENIAKFPQVVGKIENETKRSDGLIIQKQRIPIGVIALIFESRPNVVIEAAALAIKSGNALIFKGGSEANHSNRILFEILQKSIENYLPPNSIQILESRSSVAEILSLHQYVNLVIPRGGDALVKFVKSKATMPVIAHDRGLCHLYIHHDVDFEMAKNVVLNAKTSRPGVCNALESVLIHRDFLKVDGLLNALLSFGVKLKVDAFLQSKYPNLNLELATDLDYSQEWLDLIISIKTVQSVEEAVLHVQKFGTLHTEGILAKEAKAIEYFLNHVDASCIVVNASTRFNDGGELGLGAEMGISTSKLHAYGPMGAKELTTLRFLVIGLGHVR